MTYCDRTCQNSVDIVVTANPFIVMCYKLASNMYYFLDNILYKHGLFRVIELKKLCGLSIIV